MNKMVHCLYGQDMQILGENVATIRAEQLSRSSHRIEEAVHRHQHVLEIDLRMLRLVTYPSLSDHRQ